MGDIRMHAPIQVGNDIVQHSTLYTNISLLKHRLIQYNQLFKYLNGMTWMEADNLIAKLINSY